MHPLFAQPEWRSWAGVVRGGPAIATDEARSELLQRAVPVLTNVLYTAREALLQQGQQHNYEVQRRLDQLNTSINSLLTGAIPLTIQGVGHFGSSPDLQLAGDMLATVAVGQRPAQAPGENLPPAYSLLDLRTVADAWREWKEGTGGHPAVEVLEREWGTRWRPLPKQRTAFCRRKVIWDEIERRIATGLATTDAVAQVEALRGKGSLMKLYHTLKDMRKEVVVS